MKKMVDQVRRLFKSDQAMKDVLHYIISIIVILSVSLLVYNMIVTPKEDGEVVIDRDSQTIDEENLYYNDEKRFQDMLSSIKGIEDVKVMISYAYSGQQETSVEGVMIVAKGVGDVVTKNNVMSAAEAVFGLPANRITVLESK